MKSLIFLVVVSLVSTQDYNLDQIKAEGDSLVTSQVTEFRTSAENEGPIEPYIQQIKDIIQKRIIIKKKIIKYTNNHIKYFNNLKKAVNGYLDLNYIKQFPKKLHDNVSISKTIIETGLDWMNQRMESVVDTNKKREINQIYDHLRRASHNLGQAAAQVILFKETINGMTNANYQTKSITAEQQLIPIIPIVGIEIDNRIQQAIYLMDTIDN